MKTVVCFGASLTAGTVSFNYLELLGAKPSLTEFRFINHGVDGDLAWNGLQRLDKVIADRPDFVSILIGTNDINATMSERNCFGINRLIISRRIQRWRGTSRISGRSFTD